MNLQKFHGKNARTFRLWLILVIGLFVVFNQYQLFSINSQLNGGFSSGAAVLTTPFRGENRDLKEVDVSSVTSTTQAVVLLFPVDKIKTAQDAIDIMVPTGIPKYSQGLGGITFDDPVTSMEYLAKWYYSLKDEVQKNNPEVWNRYLNLAAAPRGIACEFCCGVGPQGVDAGGNLRCGCQHNPALQALTLGLMESTDYSDAEILREVMRWKSLWFPKNMVGLAIQVAGKDASSLQDLPGMVGGC